MCFIDCQHTPITLNIWYAVNATSLSIGGKSVHISMADLNGQFPSDPCIVDSLKFRCSMLKL